MTRFAYLAACASAALFSSTLAVQAATVVLYDQDFENPFNYNNDGGDVHIFSTIEDNYGGQPPGFSFAQQFTVETLNVSGSNRGGGTAAHGTGWSDPSGTGGDFAVGMLSDRQNDLLGLSFDVGAFDFFNLGIDVSSIDLSTFGAPFVFGGEIPEFQFTLYDNPTGSVGLSGSNTILDQKTVRGTASDRDVFDWTSAVLAFETAGNTNGNVQLQIDLLSGGYAAFDNLRITASDTPGDLGPVVPLPASAWLLLAGFGTLGVFARRRQA